MSDYPDWQADNEPMRAALARLHHLHRTTGQMVPEAKEQFFATLEESYFLVPNHGDLEDENGQPSLSLVFEPIEDGLMLSVFSSVAEARAFIGEDEELHRIIQSAPDFFGTIVNMAEVLEENGDALAGVVLDRASENSYFFDVSELVALSAGGRVIGPAQQVRIEDQQLQVVPMPDPSPLSASLVRAFQEVVIENSNLGLRELWAFWMTIDGKHDHLGLALACERPDAINHLGPLLEAHWQELGPKYGAFDLMILAGPQEQAIRSRGQLLWQKQSETPPQKTSFWQRLKPK